MPAAHAKGKMITAAVFPGPSRARVMVRQDWGRFKLDGFLPMLYQTFYEAGPEFVQQYTAEAVATVDVPVYSGLYIGPLDDAAFARTIDVAIGAGVSGVSLFGAGAMNAARWGLFLKVNRAALAHREGRNVCGRQPFYSSPFLPNRRHRPACRRWIRSGTSATGPYRRRESTAGSTTRRGVMRR